MAEEKPAAVQRLVRGDDGRVRVIFIDLSSLLEVMPEMLGNYEIINSGNSYFEPVKDIEHPDEPSTETSDEQINPPNGSGGRDADPSKSLDDGKVGKTPTGMVTPTAPTVPGVTASRGITASPGLTQDDVDESTSRGVVEDAADAVGSGPDPNSATSNNSQATTNAATAGGGRSGLAGPDESGAFAEGAPGSGAGYNTGLAGRAMVDYSGLSTASRNAVPDAKFMDDIAKGIYSHFGPGYSVAVTSGKGSRPGKTEANHHTGKAVDFGVIGPDGKMVDYSGMFSGVQALGNTGKFSGLGIAPGYMTEAGNLAHVDATHTGNPAAWGVDGSKTGLTNEAYAGLMGSMGIATQGKEAKGPVDPGDKVMSMPNVAPTPTSRPGVTETPGVAQAPSLNNGVGFSGITGGGAGWTGVVGQDGKNYSVEGSRASRNNNPGNIEAGTFADSHGSLGSDGRFAVFGTPQAGRKALESLLGTPGYQNGTLADAISRYAPSHENNTSAYTDSVAGALGVSPDTPMSSLSQAQISALADAIGKVEGAKPGKVTDENGNNIGTYGPNGFTPNPGFSDPFGKSRDESKDNSASGFSNGVDSTAGFDAPSTPGLGNGFGGAFGGVGSGPGRGTSEGGPSIGGQTGATGYGAASATGGLGGIGGVSPGAAAGEGISGGSGTNAFGNGGFSPGYGGNTAGGYGLGSGLGHNNSPGVGQGFSATGPQGPGGYASHSGAQGPNSGIGFGNSSGSGGLGVDMGSGSPGGHGYAAGYGNNSPGEGAGGGPGMGGGGSGSGGYGGPGEGVGGGPGGPGGSGGHGMGSGSNGMSGGSGTNSGGFGGSVGSDSMGGGGGMSGGYGNSGGSNGPGHSGVGPGGNNNGGSGGYGDDGNDGAGGIS